MSEKFTMVDDQLVRLGLPPRLVMLYGKLKFMMGKNADCWATHATLAKSLGLKLTDVAEDKKRSRQVYNLLSELKALKLIDWTRSDHFCRYRALKPDVQFIAHQMRNGLHISDVKPIAHRKESSSRKKRTSEKNPSSPTPSPMPAAGAAANANANANGKGVDDDDPNQTPSERFKARLVKRHGTRFDAETCLANVRKQLEKCTGLSLAEFLEFDREHTTGNSFHNAQGYYVSLAQKLVNRTKRQVRDAACTVTEQTKPPEFMRDSKGRCAKCGGSGTLQDGSYCDTCPIGRDLTSLAKRKPKTPVADEKAELAGWRSTP